MSIDNEVKIKNLLRGIRSILKRRKITVKEQKEFEKYIDLIGEHEEEENTIMFARISLSEKVGVAILRDYVADLKEMREEKEDLEIRPLLVALNRFTHYARREAKEDDVWIITSKDPRFDIFTHDLVPEHVLCPEDELNELLEKYNLKKRHLPKILASDPAVKAIGAKPGQVVKVFRDSSVAGKSINYRLVIKRPEG